MNLTFFLLLTCIFRLFIVNVYYVSNKEGKKCLNFKGKAWEASLASKR